MPAIRKPLAIVLLLLLAVLAVVLWRDGADPAPAAPDAAAAATPPGGPAPAASTLEPAASPTGPAAASSDRSALTTPADQTCVRGIVVDARTSQPLPGIEVVAVQQLPSFEPLVNRFRGLLQDGLFVETQKPAHILGSTLTGGDGTFELRGLPAGRVFLDARSDGHFVRTPGTARLASGETVDGIELRASPAGRVRGVVLGVDGAPVHGAAVSLRPGLNAFLGQLTERKYRWLETVTDERGRFDLPGVPTGAGYAVSAAAPTIALEEQFGVEVREGQVTELVLRGHPGATVAGRVLDHNGQPVAGANVAMVYLDLTRVLFSADGRSEPITTDADGRFSVRPIAAGRVAFVAAAEDQAPSSVEELAVVDGGVYDDLELRLGEGVAVAGLVVDDLDQPLAGATVELRPFERPNDPQFLKMMLKIRRVDVHSGADGRFVANGMTGEQLIVQASKPGYTTAVRTGVRLDADECKIQLQRGAVIRGRVQHPDGTPVPRFRVDTRTSSAAAAGAGPARDGQDDSGEPTWDLGADGGDRADFRMRFGRGDRNRGPRTVQLAEGQTMMGRGLDPNGNWREIAAPDGRFELRGVPPGVVRVRVRADGFLDPKPQEVELAAAQTSDELTFVIEPGLAVSGVVIDAATLKPVSDAQVTAYRQQQNRRRSGLLQLEMDPEDMDFLALSATQGGRSAVTNSAGRFELSSLAAGTYRFTARHPDMAKASAKEVVLAADAAIPPIEIKLDAGGGIEGRATGLGMRPLADAVIAAFSLQTGTLRSSTTDQGGFYRVDGLPPGQYVVFKSRLDERADNIPLELMSNMRLKTATVRQGRFTKLDIHDEDEDGVRVYGVVRENGAPVPRALVTLLGTDRDGFLGMGVRANAAGMDGRYELIGIKPGSHVVQVSRFQGRPMQTSFPIDVPEDLRDFQFDIDLPASEVAGRVVDSRGNPVAGVQVVLGTEDQGLADADGLIGLIAQGGLSQGRTDDHGEFRLRSVAAGTYTLRAGSRFAGGRRGAAAATGHGEASLSGVVVDGVTSVEGLVVTVPVAGSITGVVLDGSGVPVTGAEIHYAETSRTDRRQRRNPLTDLFGMQARPITSGADGRFEIAGLNPGTYDLRVDTEALEAGRLQDVRVDEDAKVDVTLRIVRGATLRLRALNFDKHAIPLAYVSLLDGKGRAVVNKVSTVSVLKRLVSSRDEIADSGWYEFGSVPPDTYTVVVAEPGKEELRLTRTIADGETVEWEVDIAAELAARARAATSGNRGR